MKKSTILFACLSTALIATAPADAKKKKQEEVTGLALQQIQARDFDVAKDVTFPSVMTVLQDQGYRITGADKDTGLITGVASTESKTSYNLFWGFGKKKRTPVVSAFIEERGAGSRIRLNFVLSKTKSRAIGTSEDEEPITDPAVYRDAFERIDKEIFVRVSLDAPAPQAAAVPDVAPAAAAVSEEPAAVMVIETAAPESEEQAD